MEIKGINSRNDVNIPRPLFLPEDFKVYSNGKDVINWPAPGFEEITLPTFNDYMGKDGGYIAIYTHDESKGLYSVGDGIYVMGQIRVQGRYNDRIFVPQGYSLGDNITQDEKFLEACKAHFPDMTNEMWVGGDTGGWFGFQL